MHRYWCTFLSPVILTELFESISRMTSLWLGAVAAGLVVPGLGAVAADPVAAVFVAVWISCFCCCLLLLLQLFLLLFLLLFGPVQNK